MNCKHQGKGYFSFLYLISMVIYGFSAYRIVYALDNQPIYYLGGILFAVFAAYGGEKIARIDEKIGTRLILSLPFFLISLVLIIFEYGLDKRLSIYDDRTWVYVVHLLAILGFTYGSGLIISGLMRKSVR